MHMSTNKMQAFHNYTDNLLNNVPEQYQTETEAQRLMLNGYTVFLMSRPEYRQDINNHRMQWIVNNFTNYEDVDKRPYYEYYKNNIVDDYSGVFNPPPCFYNEITRQERKEAADNLRELEMDDIAQHYRELAERYETCAKYMKLCRYNRGTYQTTQNKDQDDLDEHIEYPLSEFDEKSTRSQSDCVDYQDTDYDDTYDWDELYENECYEENDYDY